MPFRPPATSGPGERGKAERVALRWTARARSGLWNRCPASPLGCLAAAYLAGSLPVSNLAARKCSGVDLREVGSGTVSGSSLYEVAGFGPLALAGCLELGKGALGPLLAGPERPLLGAGAASLAVVGHDWSPWLRGQGGRGVSLLLGATAVLAPSGLAVLGLGLGLGRLARQSGAGTLLGLVALPAALGRARGGRGLVAGVLLAGPVLVKRLLGNEGHLPESLARAVSRLVADREEPLW